MRGSARSCGRSCSDADLAAIDERLADPETNPSARARLLFALSLVLDARGEYRRAAECSRQANALNMELARGPRGYTPELHVQYVESVIQGFTMELFEQLAGAGSLDLRPVFVFGLPRSGTTLVEQILASHSRVFGAGEQKFTRQSFDSIPSVLDVSGLASTTSLASRPVRSTGWRRTTSASTRRTGGGTTRAADHRQDAG